MLIASSAGRWSAARALQVVYGRAAGEVGYRSRAEQYHRRVHMPWLHGAREDVDAGQRSSDGDHGELTISTRRRSSGRRSRLPAAAEEHRQENAAPTKLYKDGGSPVRWLTR